jgi:2-polyprenyl-3-methyl-5-hydroxy-6-metoxy-1,4-benzoquinol methylase
MLSHYHAEIDPNNENNSHSSVLRMVGSNKRVLEAGCSSGHVSEVLKSQGCSVVGIEIDPQAARSAEQWLERVIIGDFEDGTIWPALENELFDVIVFADVLEHLKDPLSTLRESIPHLRTQGTVVISVPNIAHADVKIALLKGLFPYSESGLLDQTHLHFFTKDSLLALLHDAGLVATEFTRVTAPVFSTEIGVTSSDVDEHVLAAIVADREAETYQFVIKAVRDDGTASIEHLSLDLVTLSDKLLDQTRRADALHAANETLEAQVLSLGVQHERDEQELVLLRSQINKVKRVLPMRLIRRLRESPNP